ncbi:2-oxoglutarate dehydrogenase E1 component [Magnetovirga frankeli]|uniref:2-oxoglutarate dehydrogenase E1 component n=1 Tax=Magnetovirga frankeli TaxID=947516 RepID=UPI0012933F0E|nr:2-oxoglutarate dehydrogenase E1 component [gamma proteobacterium SS-5]
MRLIDRFKANSALFAGNAAFLEDLYEDFLRDPETVAPEWRQRFATWRDAANDRPDAAHRLIQDNFRRLAQERPCPKSSPQALPPAAAEKQGAVLRLINAYRVRGHQNARLDPLALREMEQVPDLEPSYHNLTPDDMEAVFNTGSLVAPDRMPLAEIIRFLGQVYCGPVGSEYMHITDTREKRWIQKRLEGYQARPEVDENDKRWLLTLLTAAEGIEKFLHSKYVGQKRFSLEGGESLIPLLDELIQRIGAKRMEEVIIGMAHRGRLNVLTNILGKPPEAIFGEFEGRGPSNSQMTSGDVKYHMGFSTDIDTPGGLVHVALGFNPSHLEIINPVVEGSVRARQHRRGDHVGDRVLPVLIHGDSSFAGQGVVMETLNLSQARGFTTGGTLHVVINNQIGFTTSNPLDTRSTAYCTDVAKMVQAPIFHVNGDDPEAVIFVTRLALDFRMQFHKDVIIDLVCYRRHGHNEADEPAVTQPEMYKKIRRRTPTRAFYAEQLMSQGVISQEESQAMVEDYRSSLEQGRVVARPVLCGLRSLYGVNWKPFHGTHWQTSASTRVARSQLRALALKLLRLPEGFEPHNRVQRILEDRRRMAEGDLLSDWGFGETLAYASLIHDGYPVRLSGQDSGRGTFFHRHAVLHNQADGSSFVPLQNLAEGQVDFLVIDSLLSEEAVLGFEYGYATAEPYGLTLWEAQFGDFANGAQVVIDQFITSGGAKWGLHCGLVMLLPHGYEGQGPEHSSARLERYLQLCAEDNIQVCVPTTPAQVFHMLRRQMLRPYRRPLIVMTPKSLLRHKLATSALEEYSEGGFQCVIDEIDELDPAGIKRLIICSGKVYYDLLEARRSRGISDTAIIRIEQLYPFPREQAREIIARYSAADSVIWCQEEPQNQGAWDQVKHRLFSVLAGGQHLYYVGRPTAAAPSVGSHKIHAEQQQRLVEDAITGQINPVMNRRILR